MEITKDILNHSSAHLLAHAIHRLYPKALFAIGPSIEEGFYYDIDFIDTVLTENDFAKIEAEMKKIVKENIKITRKEISKDEALKLFKNNPYKIELIKELKDDEKISIYEQGDFVDLCRGPHVGYTGNLKHFKLLSLAGAYWRGNSNNKQLTRIYGTSAKTKEELDAYLKLLEERKMRDHRKLGKELGLFMISEFGPGFPFWLPRGMILRNELENYWYERHQEEGYVFVKTPIMLSKELWVTSGHWANYKDNMYTSKIENKEFAIKPMNCPGGMLIYKNVLHSYKDLPIRMGELGLVHRNEASGALAGLFRVRTFTQDDAHIFCRKDQLQDVIKNLKSFTYKGQEERLFAVNNKIDSYLSAFQKEREDRKYFELEEAPTYQRVTRIEKDFIKLCNSIPKIQKVYALNDEKVSMRNKIQNHINRIGVSKRSLETFVHTVGKRQPYSALLARTRELKQEAEQIENEMLEFRNYLNSLKEDVEKAYELVSKFYYRLRLAEKILRDIAMPSVTNKYQAKIDEIYQYLEKINTTVMILPIQVHEINEAVNYLNFQGESTLNQIEQENTMLKLAESSLIYINKDRASYPELNNLIKQNEKTFFEGEFEKAYNDTSKIISRYAEMEE